MGTVGYHPSMIYAFCIFISGKVVSLGLRSRLELKELVHHPLFAIVFELEYVMSEPFAQPLIGIKGKRVSYFIALTIFCDCPSLTCAFHVHLEHILDIKYDFFCKVSKLFSVFVNVSAGCSQQHFAKFSLHFMTVLFQGLRFSCLQVSRFHIGFSRFLHVPLTQQTLYINNY